MNRELTKEGMAGTKPVRDSKTTELELLSRLLTARSIAFDLYGKESRVYIATDEAYQAAKQRRAECQTD